MNIAIYKNVNKTKPKTISTADMSDQFLARLRAQPEPQFLCVTI